MPNQTYLNKGNQMFQRIDFICYWLICAMHESDWEMQFEDSIAMRVVEGRY